MSRVRAALTGFTATAVLGLVVVGLALIAAILYFANERTQGILDAFRPRVESEVVLRGSIERMQAEGKLVVLSADVTAVSESSTDKRIFFDLIDAGRTTVRVRAPARVQYVIPLSEVGREDFFYDPETKRLLLTLPNPRLDTSIVEVSTDPSELEIEKDVGWLRIETLSGRYNENRARRLLRDAAIEAGYSGYWLPRAQESARRELRLFLKPLITSLEEDVEFDVAFVDEGSWQEGAGLPTPRR